MDDRSEVGSANRDRPVTVQRRELERQLEQVQNAFDQRALDLLAEPLLSTRLTMQQLKVLTLIAADGDQATGHDLAETLNVSEGTMSGLVDRLVEQRMVQRRDDPNDRRIRRLSVSATGSATLRSLVRTGNAMHPAVLERLSDDDLAALVRGLVALHRAMLDLSPALSTSEAEPSSA